MSVVLAIDAGTTGRSRLRPRARTARGRASPTGSSPSTSPGPGGSSTTPPRSGRAVQATAGRARRAALDEPVAAIGITDQRETVVAWDRRTGRPLHRAIVWQDRRTAARCDELRAAGPRAGWSAPTTGLVLDPYFSATKVEWLLTEGGVAAGRRPRPRHRRRLGALEPHRRRRRRRVRHRAVERQPHDALRHPHARLVRRAARPVRRARARRCPRCGPRAGGSASPRGAAACPPASRCRASPATSRRRCSARPASSRA